MILLMSKFNVKNPSGFPEFSPAEEAIRQEWIKIISSSFSKFGFIPITTPIVEREENLLGKGGNAKEMYVLKRLLDEEGDKSHSGNALRFDQTVPLALYVARHQNELTFPFRRSVIGPVFRGERAQKGRFRQFDQCDIDVIGNGELSLLNDAQIPAIIIEIFKKLDIGDFVVQINNRKILVGIANHFNIPVKLLLDTFDEKEKLSDKDFEKKLDFLGEKINNLNEFKDILAGIVDCKISGGTIIEDDYFTKLKSVLSFSSECLEGVSDLQTVYFSLVKDIGVDASNLLIDPFLARGLDYYTGTIYETKVLKYPGFGSVCSGGRYEDLASIFTGKKLPGVGISIGLTRLFSQCLEAGLIIPDKSSPTQVLLISADDVALPSLLSLGTELRTAGIVAENYLEDKKLGKKFDYADKLKIPYCIVMGENEMNNKIVQLKDMKTGEKEDIEVSKIVSVLNKKISS